MAKAAAQLHAACVARFQAACAFLEDEFEREKILELEPLRDPPQMEARMQLGLVALACRLGADGRFRNCIVFERAPHGATKRFLDIVTRARARPSTLAGHPLEMPHAFKYIIDPSDNRLTPEQELQFVRHRVAAFPESPAAWDDLAFLLARNVTEGPEYPGVLRRLNELAPRYWWAANELAWLEVQAGQYAKALPLATMAQAEAPVNPYVLKTLAATLRGLGRCAEAIADQRRAVERLPKEWPEPERARFARVLTEYQQQCTEGVTAAPRSH
ncbi:tetratricopeptide repeat protein [Corallococcus terminator]